MKKLLFLLIFLPFLAISQKLENVKAVAEGDKIIITYDIAEGMTGDSFDVALFASHNNFSSPLQKVSGDIGRGQGEGKTKRIEWDAKTEIGEFKGQLSFEIRVEVFAIFSLVNKFKTLKRGKDTPITWRGGQKDENVKIELLKAGVVEETLTNGSNNGAYKWNISSKQKPGKDYKLRLSNGKDVVTSDAFAIKHKIPTAVKVAPAVLLIIFSLPSKETESTQRALPTYPAVPLN